MEGSWAVLGDLLTLLVAALLLGALAEQLRQSALIGYIVAGTLVGPSVMGWVASNENVVLIAELGVALLLFTIGLEFSFSRLRRVGRVALVGGCAQVLLTMGVGWAVGVGFGLSMGAGVALGAMVAVSSTACVLRLLRDSASLESLYGRNAFGILLFQDVAVVPLVLLTVVLSRGEPAWEAAVTLGKTGLVGVVLVGVFYVLFVYVAPRVMHWRSLSRNRELPILLTLVMAVGSALGAHWVGVSAAMGSFVAGILLGQSPFAVQVRSDVSSLRTACVTLFFASVGLYGDPVWVYENLGVLLLVLVGITLGKMLLTGFVVRVLGYSVGVSMATGLCLAQVGEFSFVLAEVAREGLFDEYTFRLMVTATILSLLLTPFMTGAAPKLADLVAGWSGGGREVVEAGAEGEGMEGEGGGGYDVTIIGFGPAGQQAAYALLPGFAGRVQVIDLNPKNLLLAQRAGLHTLIGDATQLPVLEHAHVGLSRVVLVTLPDPGAARTIVQHCKRLGPGVATVVRGRYHVVRWELMMAGATEVIDEEGNVGRSLAKAAGARLAAVEVGGEGEGVEG